MLSDGTRSTARDIMLLAIGGLFGGVSAFLKTWEEVSGAEVREPMNLGRLADLAIPLMAIIVIIVMALLLFLNRKGGVKGLVARIRARTQSRRL